MSGYTEAEQNLITLSSFEELNYKYKYAALSSLGSYTPDFSLVESLLIKNGSVGVYNKVRDSFYDGKYREKLFEGLEKRNVDCVTIASEDYPAALRQIPDPPIVLYLKGNRKLLSSRCFSVVGSRRTSPLALAECKKTVKEISQAFTIVSGSAAGADCAALQSAENGAISVLAFGFDHLGGTANDKIVLALAESGLVISEHHPSVGARNYFFPFRNRIIAGLSEGTLIVSAGKKSGALITADYAAEFGREVFAFPYNIGVMSGEGCNELIKNGAYLCANPLDILSVFGLDLKSRSVSLTEEEQRVLRIIGEHGEAFLPAVAEELGVAPYVIIPVVSSLEIKGMIMRLGGNRYGKI